MSERPSRYLVDVRSLAMIASAAVVAGSIAVLFVWMTPRAAAREVRAACQGLQSAPRNDAIGGKLPVPALELALPDHTGRTVRLADFRGKVVVLNFWGSWCSVCKSEKPSLTSMTRELAQDGFEVI